jgi:hypothetical protein
MKLTSTFNAIAPRFARSNHNRNARVALAAAILIGCRLRIVRITARGMSETDGARVSRVTIQMWRFRGSSPASVSFRV